MGLALGEGTLYFGDVNKAYKSISVKEISLVEYAEDTNQIKKNLLTTTIGLHLRLKHE